MSDLSDRAATRFGISISTGEDLPEIGTLTGILERRTIRRYADRAVPDGLRKILLACAQSAPAKSDLQQYAIIDITDADRKQKIAELSGTAWLATAPILLVFCADIRRAQRICEMRGKPYAQNTLDSFMNAVIDASLAFQNYVTAAEAAGLGCCPISQVRRDLGLMAELCALPDGVVPIAGLAAGWPAEERDVTLRLPPAVVVHENAYDDTHLAEEIDAYDQRRHALRPTPPDKQALTDKYGIADFYGWSENQARRLSVPDGLTNLRTYLEKHGFNLC